MAGVMEIIPLLIGLGVEELSVGTHQLPKIKQAIRKLSMKDCEEMAEKALKCRLAKDIYDLSKNLAAKAYGEYII